MSFFFNENPYDDPVVVVSPISPVEVVDSNSGVTAFLGITIGGYFLSRMVINPQGNVIESRFPYLARDWAWETSGLRKRSNL